MRRLAVLSLALLLAACGAATRPQPQPQAPAAIDAIALRQRAGAAATVVASLLVQLVPQQGDTEVLTLRLWSTADRAIRLRVQKLDVAVIDALVQPDGAYRAVLLRERVATSGRLGAADDPQLLRDLRLLMAELRDGPVPAGVEPDVAGAWADPTGWRAVLVDGADGLPAGKSLREGDTEMRHLDYLRWQAFEGLLRPSQVELRAHGDPTVVRVRVKSLDDPGAISAERMALSIPADAEQVTPAVFAQRMP